MPRRLVLPTVLVAVVALVVVSLFLFGGPSGTEDEAPAPSEARSESRLVDLVESDLTSVLSFDSIPAVDQPKFIRPGEAGFLSPREPVVSLELGGQSRAYPVQILTWHEIVNDVVADTPVAVTYCPLCNSAVAYRASVDGRTLDFGTSGKLYNSALVMYDRPTESLWLHFEGLAIEGSLEGTQLEAVPVQMLSFGQWRREHPDGLVLSRDTGFSRDYGANPYEGYDTANQPFLFSGEVDDRLPKIERVVGVKVDGKAAAYPYDALQRASTRAGVADDTVGGRNIAVFWKSGTASALDKSEIAGSRDVGSVGVFMAEVEGRKLTFGVKGDDIVDDQTDSTWSLSGKATAGPLEGRRLAPVEHLDTFWFAWASHNPDTEIWGG